MSIEADIQINRIAQGDVDRDAAIVWFHELDEDEAVMAVRTAGNLAEQARVSISDVDALVPDPRTTPEVLLAKWGVREALPKLIRLKGPERDESFLLLTGLLGRADQRRRDSACIGGCTHWWHRDLNDPHVRDEIEKDYAAGRLA